MWHFLGEAELPEEEKGQREERSMTRSEHRGGRYISVEHLSMR